MTYTQWAGTQQQYDALWRRFRTVRPVHYRPFDPAADAPAATGPTVDGFPVAFGSGPEGSGDDGSVFVTRRVWVLRASQLGAVRVTDRGVVAESDGTLWRVERAEYLTHETRVKTTCVRVG